MVDANALPPAFEREYGCTALEWARWMRETVTHGRHVDARDEGSVEVALGGGRLTIAWKSLAPRSIALIQLPRLAVSFRFEEVADIDRAAFMRRLDLHLQRGGG